MIDFVINPLADGEDGVFMKRTAEKLKTLLDDANVTYSFHFTEYKGHAKTLTGELIDGGATDIVAVGGDGTLHEVINGFKSFDKVNLGLIPAGTGNDFASAVNLPLDVEKALSLILEGRPKYTDFIELPTVRGINIVGMGMDVEVLKAYSNLPKKTKMGYMKCLVGTLFKYDCITFDAEIDGERKTYNSFIACIANGRCYGGGIPICPCADPSDGKLDFLAVDKMGKIKVAFAFPKLKKGKILSLKQTYHQAGEVVEIFPEGHYTVNVDGELYDDIPFKAKIVSGVLKMYR